MNSHDEIVRELKRLNHRVDMLFLYMNRLDAGVSLLIGEIVPKQSPVVGIVVDPGVPVVRPPSCEGVRMSKKCSVSLVKKSSSPAVAAANVSQQAVGNEFVFVDNEDSTCTVHGVNAAGNPVDISNVATLNVTSSDPSKLALDEPIGMTFKMKGVAPTEPGSPVIVSVTATWNDGSIGPFSFDLPCTLTGSAVTGIVVVPGTPVVR
jgi:hypothetical protein